MSKVESATACFAEGFACSQAILAAYGEDFGIEREAALRLSDGFAGGIAGLGNICGAVSGALMVIGLKHGRTSASDREARAQTKRFVREFMSRFEARNGTTVCRELLGCDIDTPEKSQMAREKGLFTTVCPAMVRDAAEILEELLEDS